MLASGATAKGKDVQTAIILHCAGPQAIEVYEHLEFDKPEDKQDPEKLLAKLEAYCSPKQNIVMQTFRFWTTTLSSPFDSFLTELRTRADSCKFDDMKDRMIRDKIVFTVSGKLQELLLRDADKLDLKRTVEICRSYEMSLKQAKEISGHGTGTLKPTQVHKMSKAKAASHKPSQQSHDPTKPKSQMKECQFCGLKHKFGKSICPAWGKQCGSCGGRNHFKAKCKSSKVRQLDSEVDLDSEWLKSIQVHTVDKDKDNISALMSVNGCDIKFQLDSGADVNTICQRFVKKQQVTPTQQNLIMWNKAKYKPLGQTTLPVTNPRNKKTTNVTFSVVPNSLNCLLGLKTIKSMGLITVNTEEFIDQVQEDNSSLGDLGFTHFFVDADVKPKILPCRKIPVALYDKVKEEIKTLENRGILIPIDEPTDWVSQMTVVRKPNGKLRLCIDPQPLNMALKREHYKLPTIDDVMPKLNKAKVFTKLDVKEAFWHVKLDEASSKLTTMITPFGR